VAAIRYAHKIAGHEPPTNSEAVKATARGIRRTIGAAVGRKAPIMAEMIRAMAQAAPDTSKGLRDRALLLLGFAGAFRRSELVALNVADLAETEDGFRVTIRRSKTDQEGEGATIAIARGSVACPVKAVKAWLYAVGINEGPLFRSVSKGGHVSIARLSDKSVADIKQADLNHLWKPLPQCREHFWIFITPYFIESTPTNARVSGRQPGRCRQVERAPLVPSELPKRRETRAISSTRLGYR
jgi:integrase